MELHGEDRQGDDTHNELHAAEINLRRHPQDVEHECRTDVIKNEFLAHICHEFRTPLHALIAYIDMLEREVHGPLTDAQRTDLKRMRLGHEHLLGLANRMLDFARINGGQCPLHITPVAVPALIRTVLEMFSPQCAAKGIRCVAWEGAADVRAAVDADALRQILINVVGNAIKFSYPKTTVSLFWETERDEVAISVADTGPGVPADKLDLIFEPFMQLATQTSDRLKGTGLGLTISRALTEAMGGRLTVVSTLGRGTTFIISVPAV